MGYGELLSFLGMLLSFFVLAFLAFRGVNIMIASMAATAILALFSGQNPLLVLTGVYMEGFTGFIGKYFLIFVFSAVFGSLMAESGATQTIAFYIQKFVRKCPPSLQKTAAICSVALVNAVLTYGGMSLFVVVFTLVYIAKDLFEELDIPWYFYSCSSLGSASFTMTMLPGSPQLPNLIPTTYLGTTPMAAPVLGIIGTVISLCAGVGFIYIVTKRAERRGDGFLPSGAEAKAAFPSSVKAKPLPLWKCLLPSAALLIVMNLLGRQAELALLLAVFLSCIVFWREIPSMRRALGRGASNAVSVIGNPCAVVGFGSAVSAAAGYRVIMRAVDFSAGEPYVMILLASGLTAAIVGSAAGGVEITLSNFSQRFLATGISPDVIHRLVAISGGAMGSTPHTSGYINQITVAKLSHSLSYKYFFVLSLVIPYLTGILCAYLASLGVA